MPFSIPTLPAESERILNDLLESSGSDLSRSDERVLARAIAGVSYGLYGYMSHISQQITPYYCDEQMLELFSNLKETHRTKETRSTGSLEVSGAAGSMVKRGHIWKTRTGVQFECRVDTVLGSDKTYVPVRAVVAGRTGNIEGGTELTSISPILGVSDKAVVSEYGLGGGSDIEPIEQWRDRVCKSFEVIPHGGNPDDYVMWARQVPGVTRAWCVRNWMGPGTVGVFFLRDNDNEIVPNESAISTVKNHIETVRPVQAELHVAAPAVRPINYHLVISPDTENLRNQVMVSLDELHRREADLGVSILRSKVRQAISNTPGVTDHRVLEPTEHEIVAEQNEILTVGEIVWS